jgi:hypothetical protein
LLNEAELRIAIREPVSMDYGRRTSVVSQIIARNILVDLAGCFLQIHHA